MVILNLQSKVKQELSEAELSQLVSTVSSNFSVDETEISAELKYVASGTMDVVLDIFVSSEQVVSDLVKTLSQKLDIHPKDIQVVVDRETGTIKWTVSSEEFNKTQEIVNELETLNLSQLSDEIEGLSVETIQVPESVYVDLTFVVTEMDTEVIERAVDLVNENFSALGYEIFTDSIFFLVSSKICLIFSSDPLRLD